MREPRELWKCITTHTEKNMCILHKHINSYTLCSLYHLLFLPIFPKIGGRGWEQLCKNSFPIFGNFHKADTYLRPHLFHTTTYPTKSVAEVSRVSNASTSSVAQVPQRIHCFQKKQLRKKCKYKSPKEMLWG